MRLTKITTEKRERERKFLYLFLHKLLFKKNREIFA